MKFSILALGAAVAGISTQCAAQLHIESSFPAPAPQARLISQQEIVGSSLIDEPTAKEADMPYFAPTPPQAEITANSLLGSQTNSQPAQEEDPAQSANNESDATPPGQPVKRNIAAGAPLHVLAMTPEVGMVPVCWQTAGGCPTPNPTANYMLQTWCTNGLWDGYACQRAKQCAHIQQQLFGHNRYTCGGCSACGAGGRAVQSSCATCGPTASQCAQNTKAPAPQQASAPTQSLLAAAPSPQSPLIGELQAGLPIVDANQVPVGTYPPSNFGQAAGKLTNAPADRLPNGQPLLQLPTDVPTVPQNAVTPAMPQLPSNMPALPMPANNPVVASRSSASLR